MEWTLQSWAFPPLSLQQGPQVSLDTRSHLHTHRLQLKNSVFSIRLKTGNYEQPECTEVAD